MYINNGNLTEDEKVQLVDRNKQLFELIEMDPKNRIIYEQELIENNMRLVTLVCKKLGQYNEDSFQIGCIGLIMAAKTYDSKRGVPFSSYATFLINRELRLNNKVAYGTFEYQMNGAMDSLDAYLDLGEGKASVADTIADTTSEYDFVKCLDDFDLATIFSDIVQPTLDKLGSTRQSQSTYDIELWKRAEMALLLDLIEVETTNVNLTKIARMLGLSNENVKKKHQRVLRVLREELIKQGYVCLEDLSTPELI